MFVHGDGKTFEILPLSIFPSSDTTVLRIGRTIYIFDKDGGYDGVLSFRCRACKREVTKRWRSVRL